MNGAYCDSRAADRMQQRIVADFHFMTATNGFQTALSHFGTTPKTWGECKVSGISPSYSAKITSYSLEWYQFIQHRIKAWKIDFMKWLEGIRTELNNNDCMLSSRLPFVSARPQRHCYSKINCWPRKKPHIEAHAGFIICMHASRNRTIYLRHHIQ